MKKILALTLVCLTFSAFFPVYALDAPVLQFPGNGTTQTTRYITFIWNPVSGAVKYELQYSTNSSFSYGNYTSITNITDYSYTVTSPLANCTTFWWRVRATDSTSGYYYTSSSWSTVFWFRVDEIPITPTLTSPTNDAKVTSKRPTFYWSGTSGYVYSLQVANDTNFTVNLKNYTVSATQYQIPVELSGGDFYWRVKARASGCTTETPSSTYHFTIDFNYVLPKSPVDGDSISDNTPTFEWNPVDNATKYKIWVTTSSDTTFLHPIFPPQETTQTTFTPVPILGDSTYIWKVQAYISSAWTTGTSPPYSFTINTGTGLGEPAGLTPSNGVTVTFPLTLLWGSVTNAYSYTLQYSKSEAFSTGNTELTIFGTSYSISGTLIEGRWYWHVRANNSQGQSGPWADTQNFNVGLPVPVILSPDSPQNNSTQSSSAAVFDWDDPVSAPEGYTLQYFTLQYSTSNVFSPQSTIQVTTGIVSRYPSSGTMTLSDGTYYWHVKSTWKKDSDQTIHESGWSDAYSFTIMTTGPGVPQLISPINGAILSTATPELKWTTVSGSNITGYKIRYRKATSNPGEPVNWVVGTYSEITITGQSIAAYTPSPLLENITGESYWWSVASVDTLGMMGQFAYPISFRIDVTPPDGSRITLIQPVGVTVDSGTPTFSWKVPLTTPAVYGDVSSWTLEFATNVSFTVNVQTLQPLINLSATISGSDVIVSYTIPSTSPMANGAYFWHVAASDAAGNKSQYSAIGSFTVASVAPPQTKVSLISPANGATNVPTKPTFVWNAFAGNVTYSLQVSDSSSDFTGTHLKITQSGLSSVSYIPTIDLSPGTYYWHVNSTVANAQWSDTWSFTVGTVSPSGRVTLVSPTNGTTNVSTTPSFSWQQLSGATGYTLLVSDSQTDFSSTHLKVNKTGLTTTSWGTSADWSSNTPTSLSNGTYWWKVTSNVASSDSDVWSFTVGAGTTGNAVVITAQAACSTTAVTGASVVLSSGTFTSATVATDANGVANISNVPNGTYSLTVTVTGYDTYTESITVSGQVTKTVSLVTAGNGIITGVVYFDDVQHPASNVTVRIYEQTSGNQAQTVVSNTSGEFCALVSKNITYYLVVENYTDQKYEGVVPAATAATKINIVIESKGSITGVIADQDENVVQDAKVTVRNDQGQFVSSMQTDNKGQFTFKILPGKFYVEVTKYGFLTYTSPMFTVAFKQTYELGLIKLTPDKGTLVVNLSDKTTNNPLDGTVSVQDASGRVVTSISISSGVGSAEMLADTYTLVAKSPGYEDTSTSVKVEGGKQATISITLERAMGTIKVSVLETVEGKDQPVVGADVNIDGEKAGVTDENGIFTKGGFEPGVEHSVQISKEGYATSKSQQAKTEAVQISELSFTFEKSSPLLTYILYGVIALVILGIIGFVGYKFMSRGAKEEEVTEEEEARPEIRKSKPGEHRGGLPDKSYK